MDNAASANMAKVAFFRLRLKHFASCDKSIFSSKILRYCRSIIRKYASSNQNTTVGIYATNTYPWFAPLAASAIKPATRDTAHPLRMKEVLERRSMTRCMASRYRILDSFVFIKSRLSIWILQIRPFLCQFTTRPASDCRVECACVYLTQALYEDVSDKYIEHRKANGGKTIYTLYSCKVNGGKLQKRVI